MAPETIVATESAGKLLFALPYRPPATETALPTIQVQTALIQSRRSRTSRLEEWPQPASMLPLARYILTTVQGRLQALIRSR